MKCRDYSFWGQHFTIKHEQNDHFPTQFLLIPLTTVFGTPLTRVFGIPKYSVHILRRPSDTVVHVPQGARNTVLQIRRKTYFDPKWIETVPYSFLDSVLSGPGGDVGGSLLDSLSRG